MARRATRRPPAGWLRAALGAAILVLTLSGERVMTQPFDLHGHRGARGLAPENTLPGFALALRLGVSTLEMDAAVTADGAVVISHDPILNPAITRGPDGQFLAAPGPAIRSLTLAELRRYDVGRLQPGTRYAAQFPDQQPADGTRIPTLVEVVQMTRRAGADRVWFNIETKVFPDRPDITVAPEAMAAALVRVIEAEGIAARTMIQSFDWRTLAWVQANAPHIATSYLTEPNTVRPRPDGRPSAWLAGQDPAAHGGSIPRTVAAAGGRIWSPHYRMIDAAQVAEAKMLGVRVVPWTVNDPAEMAGVIALGVDGLITDRPDLLRRVMEERGLALPAPLPAAAP
ncbi:MAG: glycerophosphodiester phosphodiesterase [Alphaproteobacteria bacterium]|nr:glycerophosphodiester phosphodiesterase [Alphaproteobacteria bacterium]